MKFNCDVNEALTKQEKYRTLTNLEINKLVGSALGFTFQGHGYIDGADGIYNYMSKSENGYRNALPDYCGSWLWAGEIIESEGISLLKDSEICCEQCDEVYKNDQWEASDPLDNDTWFTDTNPLKAAMIVFLMMRDKDNA